MSVIGSDHRVSLDSGGKKSLGWGGRVAIIVAVAAIVIFALSVMLGNYLRSVSMPEDTSETTSGTFSPTAAFVPSPTLTAIARPFIPHTGTVAPESSAASDTPAFPNTEAETSAPASRPEDKLEYNAVSLLLRDRGEGTAIIYFTSDTVARFGADRVADGACALADGLRPYKMAGDYVSAVFYLAFPTEPANTKNVMRAYEFSLVCELAGSGADEIILFSDRTDSDGIAEMLDFAASVRAQTDTALGIALGCDFLLSDDAGEQLNRLSARSDGFFLALDLRSSPVPALMSAEEVISDRVTRTSELVLRYAMRVLVGCGINPDYPGQMLCARAAGAVSVQSVGS